MQIHRLPTAALAGRVIDYYGFGERTGTPRRRREGPGVDVVVVVAFEEHWLIDGVHRISFLAGMYDRQVTTEHPGRSLGMQINLDPLAARALVGLPLHELAHRTVPLEDVIDEPLLVERLATARDWEGRFALLDAMLGRRLADARPLAEVAWAWRQLRARQGDVAIGALATELGWSRKRLVARFRDQIGLTPKAAARMLRFERARVLAGTRPWADIALECGFSDQSHLINEFRAITGRTPETFLQDSTPVAA
jgi:AraC-like DNA-binding protein